ncbi:MAG TPA: DUF2784 domain-containing protein [Nitrososphaera sp.]|jgi:hypothetical protein|nr:DUF2784 domain-containing protein [Nitrososphaera sp.]
MAFRILADFVLILHFAFVLFVAVGGLLVLRWPPVMLLHLPAVVWGVLVECANWTCPLNPLEDWLRRLGGEVSAAYTKGFIDYYISLIIQPENLTRSFQITMGLSALGGNLLIYAYIYFRSRRAR